MLKIDLRESRRLITFVKAFFIFLVFSFFILPIKSPIFAIDTSYIPTYKSEIFNPATYGKKGFYNTIEEAKVAPDGRVFVTDYSSQAIIILDRQGLYIDAIRGFDPLITYPISFAFDSMGNIYVAYYFNNTIVKYNNSLERVAAWTSPANGGSSFTTPYGLTIDADDNLYVTERDANRVQKFDTNGNYITKWGTTGAGNGQFNRPRRIAVDTTNEFVYVIEENNARVQKFDLSGNYVTKWGSSGSGDGQFSAPRGIAVDASGNVWVADTNNHRIQKFTTAGTFIAKWGSYGTDNGQFNRPYSINFDSDSNIYVNEYDGKRIQKFNINMSFIDRWKSPRGSDDGQFNDPDGITIDSSGNIYVTENGNDRIQKFNSSGTFITKWGSLGSGDGQFNNPYGIAVDSSDHVYVVDSSNNRIQKFTATGTFVTKWGSSGLGDGQFNGAYNIAVDALNNVYVSEQGNDRIQKFDSNGAFITKWGSLGSGDGQFNNPGGIAFDSSGIVYVVDTNNHRIQKYDSDGVFITNWGSLGSGDGQFGTYFYDITIDFMNNIFVGDSWGNFRIQKFDTNGNYLGKLGHYGAGENEFSMYISDVHSNYLGQLYAVDYIYSRIIILQDQTDPTGSVSINNANTPTTNPNITLTLSAQDNHYTDNYLSMMISESADFSGASWESYTTAKTYRLSSDQGDKTIYVKYKDYIGNESSAYSVGIKYQPVSLNLAPSGVSDPDSGTAVLGAKTVTNSDEVSVNWDRPADTSNIHEYVVHYREIGSSTWKTESAGPDADSISWDPGEGNWEWYLEIVYTDGSTSETSTYKFEVDQTVPEEGTLTIDENSVTPGATLLLAYGSPLIFNFGNTDWDTVIEIWNWDKTIHYTTMVCGSGVCDHGDILTGPLTLVIYTVDEAGNESDRREIKVSPFTTTATYVSEPATTIVPAVQGAKSDATTTQDKPVHLGGVLTQQEIAPGIVRGVVDIDTSINPSAIKNPGIVNGAVDVAPAQSTEPPKKLNIIQKIWNKLVN